MRRFVSLLAGFVGALILLGVGYGIGSGAKSDSPVITLPADEGAKASSAPVSTPPKKSQITEGIWEVGMAGGVASGTYRVTEPLDAGSTCYWAIMSGPGNEPDDIKKNDIATGGTPQVKLAKGEWFKTSGCGVWERR